MVINRVHPILDSNSTTGRKLDQEYHSILFNITNEEKRKRKFKRAYQRFMLGIGMPGKYRLLTLTTPVEFSGSIHDAWRKFLKRMRRRGLIREYYIVKEWNKAHTCQHLHVVLRLDYIGYQVARQQWKEVTGAVWVHVDKIHSHKGMARYLGKYLNKAYADEPRERAYWYAYEWIYRKWRDYSTSMFKLGVPVSIQEHQLIRKIGEQAERVIYMNRRLLEATWNAICHGMMVDHIVKYY